MKNVILVVATLASLAPAAAFADETYTVTPVPPADTRIKFTPPTSAVFVVNQTTDTITMCFPDTDKDNNYVVSCTPPTDLPK
ncbi:MAG TPA: hypothetical protein VG894_13450 [Bauldia sp.]|nr:hypothetical protein [Bauldia sp.]